MGEQVEQSNNRLIQFVSFPKSAFEAIKEVLSCAGHVPIALYKTDFKLIFILIAVYTSVVAQFRQTANQEADRDIDSGVPFMINEEWVNDSISGGVSDRILWNCRPYSRTHTYYSSLYLGLIISYLSVVVAYFLAQIILTFISLRLTQALKYKHKEKTVYILEVAANGFKVINNILAKLEKVKQDYVRHKDSEIKRKALEDEIENANSKLNEKWEALTTHDHKESYVYNWCIVLYIIPRLESLFMFCLLTFALTSYDPHPLGCVSPIEIVYNETESVVILITSQTVINYQRVSVLLSIGIAIVWIIVKIVQYMMLPRIKWGIIIIKKTKGCTKGWAVRFKGRGHESKYSPNQKRKNNPVTEI